MGFTPGATRYGELAGRLWKVERDIEMINGALKELMDASLRQQELMKISIKQQAEGTPMVEILREMYEEEKDLRRKTALSQAIGAINYQTEHRTLF